MNVETTVGQHSESSAVSALFRRVIWRILPFICLCYIASYLDRIQVGFAKLQMLDDLGFSEAVFGLGAGVFFIGYIIFEIPSNVVLERIGARIWMARIMVTWGAISTCGALVQTPTQFYVMRFFLGVAEAGFLPGALYYLSLWFPSYRRSRIIALLMIGIPLASIIGGPLSGGIMRQFAEVAGLAGWQWLFILTGLPTVALGFIALYALPAGPKEARWLKSSEQEILQGELDRDSATATHTLTALRDGLTNPKVWVLGGIDFAGLIGIYVISFWMPTFIKSAGIVDPLEIGLWTIVPNVVGLVAMLIIGATSDRFRERRFHVVVPFVLAAVALAASTRLAEGSLLMTITLFSLANAGVQGPLPAIFSLPTTFLRGPAAAAGFALVTSIANVAGLISNSLVGFALDITGSAGTALLFFSSILILGALLVLSLPAKTVNR